MSSFQREPPAPEGFGDLAVWMRQFKMWVMKSRLLSVTGGKLIPDPKGGFHLVIQQPRPAGGGGISGWHRPASGKYEADPTQTYDRDTMVYISPGAALVLTGMRDAANPTGGLVQSCSGWWLALRNVPAKTSVGGNDVWNLPQNPYPNPAAPVMDNPANYWAYWGDTAC